jgi:hypothetical protein
LRNLNENSKVSTLGPHRGISLPPKRGYGFAIMCAWQFFKIDFLVH